MTPAEKMVDDACTPIDKPDNIKEGEVYVTHSGVVDIGGVKLRCYILSDGKRIFDADDVHNFFEPLNSVL